MEDKCSVKSACTVLYLLTALTYHIEYSLGSQLSVLVGQIRGDLTLELIELPELHFFHEQIEFPWEENIC